MANTGGVAPIDGDSAAGTPSLSTGDKIEVNQGIQHEQKPSEHQGFSAATLMLINRVRGQGAALPLNSGASAGAAGTPGYEEVRRRVLEGMKTSDNMTLPPLPPSAKRNTGVRFPGPVKSRGQTPVGGHAKTSTSGIQSTGSLQNQATTPSSAPKSRATGRNGSARRGQKRKRVKEEESETGEESDEMSDLGGDSESDGSDDMPDFPAMTQSGRMIVKPAQFNPASSEAPPRKKSATYRSLGKNAEQALCKRCGRGHSPASNMIVFCDGCNTPYHQMCHDPVVSDEVTQDENKDWFCSDCDTIPAESSAPHVALPVATSTASDVNKSSGWAAKSVEEKRAYLSSMPQAHLVSLLIQATTLHPDVPIFPVSISTFLQPLQPQALSQNGNQSESLSQQHPQSQSTHPQNQPRTQSQPPPIPQQQPTQQPPSRRKIVNPPQPFPPSATSGLFSRTEANPSATINFIRKIHGSTDAAPTTGFATSFDHSATSLTTPKASPMTSPTRPFQQASSAPPTTPHIHQKAAATKVKTEQLSQPQPLEDDDDRSRESTPASPPYPRPGNGLMAKLPPDHEDLEWLVGDGDDPAVFSHTVFDKDGRAEKRVDTVGPVTGVAQG